MCVEDGSSRSHIVWCNFVLASYLCVESDFCSINTYIVREYDILQLGILKNLVDVIIIAFECVCSDLA